MERPAEMLSSVAPSFCACLTELFMNTVQRLPRSTGRPAKRPSAAKSSTEYPSACAKVCKKLPQPLEQASFRKMSLIAPSAILKHFMSWPPMSIMKSTSGRKCRAAVKCATVSTRPKSAWKACLARSSP